jgi:L-rhamnose mutarotase
MKRFAFKMMLIPGNEAEYERRHSQIWPELKELLKKDGIANYSIFLDKETSTLFAYQEITGNSSSQEMGNREIVSKWWNYMADIMAVNPDNSPCTVPLSEVFYMK